MLSGSVSYWLVPRGLAQLHPSGKRFIFLFRKCDVRLKEADEQTVGPHGGPGEMHDMGVLE